MLGTGIGLAGGRVRVRVSVRVRFFLLTDPYSWVRVRVRYWTSWRGSLVLDSIAELQA